MSELVTLSPESVDAVVAGLISALAPQLLKPAPVQLGPLTCEQFARAVGRSAEYVQDHCRTGGIRHLPGKPYRILPEELVRYRAEGLRTGSARRARS